MRGGLAAAEDRLRVVVVAGGRRGGRQSEGSLKHGRMEGGGEQRGTLPRRFRGLIALHNSHLENEETNPNETSVCIQIWTSLPSRRPDVIYPIATVHPRSVLSLFSPSPHPAPGPPTRTHHTPASPPPEHMRCYHLPTAPGLCASSSHPHSSLYCPAGAVLNAKLDSEPWPPSYLPISLCPAASTILSPAIAPPMPTPTTPSHTHPPRATPNTNILPIPLEPRASTLIMGG